MSLTAREVFPKNLQKIMSEKDLKQKDIAQVLGVTPSAINDWVRGKKYPRVDKIETLAKYFGIDKSALTEEQPRTLTPAEVGTELRSILKSKDLSPAEVDKLASLKLGTTAKIIAGKYEPHIDVAIKLSAVLDVPAPLILGVQEDAQAISRQRFRTRLYQEIPDLILNDDEITEIINYIKYLMSKRK